jgi:hypothetical protein
MGLSGILCTVQGLGRMHMTPNICGYVTIRLTDLDTPARHLKSAEANCQVMLVILPSPLPPSELLSFDADRH